ncbi:MAG: cation:proton antiporter [bacterium]
MKNERSFVKRWYCLFLLLFLLINPVFASGGEESTAHNFGLTFFWIALILILAKVGSVIEKIKQPAVLGELLIGLIIGNLYLMNFNIFEPIKSDIFITFLAELGVVILLFQIGLESNIAQMKKVGWRAFFVAIIGVVVPFTLGAYFVGPWVLPGLSANAYLFLGATLTATSVGITARVFKDLNKLQTKEAQIVLGAAVIDDVLGLIILAVVSAIVLTGAISFGAISLITGKALLFLAGSLFLGQLIAPRLGYFFSIIHTGVGMKITLAIAFGLIMAYLSQLIGLAPIVGAFAAGLILDPVHFRYFKDPKIVSEVKDALSGESQELRDKIEAVVEPHAERHIEDLIEPIGYFLVPIFFVMTGMNVKLDSLFDTKILLLALGITVVAFIGKVVAGLAAGKVDKWIVGVGMIPRGEVGLIFAMTGKALGVVNDEIFSIIVVMVILTTLLTPPILTYLLRKQTSQQSA